MNYKILSISDTVLEQFFSAPMAARFSGVDLLVSCGDLPRDYLEYVADLVRAPLFFVLGNHDLALDPIKQAATAGGEYLHHRAVRYRSLLLAGVDGSIKYSNGPNQYSQNEMWLFVLRLVPALLINRIFYGRYLDVFITHAPPLGINDRLDLPHQGIKAFRWLLEKFRPAVHLHGHVHIYRADTRTVTNFGRTKVINTYGYSETQLETGRDQPPVVDLLSRR